MSARPEQVVSELTLAIRTRAKDEAHGCRGLYVIGPSSDSAIAKVPNYADKPERTAKLIRASIEGGDRTASRPERREDCAWSVRLC